MRRRGPAIISLAILGVLIATTPAPAITRVVPRDRPASGLVYRNLAPGTAAQRCLHAFAVLDRSGRAVDCTHGPDAAPGGTDLNEATAPVPEGAASASIACEPGDDGSSGKRVQALYVYESDETNRFATYEASFRAWAGAVEQIFADSAAKTGGERHVRWVHDGSCVLDIEVVAVANGALGSFSSMRSALAGLGYDRNDRKYSIWADSSVYCGIGSLYNDDRDTTSNYHNAFTGHARTDRGCWGGATEAHELMHNLGGVQASAPHATGVGYWHCTDEYDLMCYSDGGGSMSYVCTPSGTHNRLFDCGDDDYFSTAPGAGSYLDTHWNTADSGWLFAGPPAPAAPSGLAATANGTTSVDVAWVDEASDETAYELQRKVSGGLWGTIATLAAGATAHADTGLTPNTTYVYRARAARDAVVSGWSNTASATTDAVPPPAAPTGLSATADGADRVDLTWTDNAGDESGYQVQRKTDGSWAAVASLGADTAAWTDSGLDPVTTYTYRVRALGDSNSAWSNTASATTDDVPPEAPGTVVADATHRRITLTWADMAANETAFEIERKVEGGTFEPLITLSADVTTHKDTSVAPDTAYVYRIRAINDFGASAWVEISISTDPAPRPPRSAKEWRERPSGDGKTVDMLA